MANCPTFCGQKRSNAFIAYSPSPSPSPAKDVVPLPKKANWQPLTDTLRNYLASSLTDGYFSGCLAYLCTNPVLIIICQVPQIYLRDDVCDCKISIRCFQLQWCQIIHFALYNAIMHGCSQFQLLQNTFQCIAQYSDWIMNTKISDIVGFFRLFDIFGLSNANIGLSKYSMWVWLSDHC